MQLSETTILEPIAEHHAEPAVELIDNNRAHLKNLADLGRFYAIGR